MNSQKKKITFDSYTRPNGRNEFELWLLTLSIKDKAKLLSIMESIEEHGLLIARQMHWVDKLDDNLFEIRSKFGSNTQRALYFHVHNHSFIITHGFTKKTQKTPKGEMEKAKKIRSEYYDEIK